MRDIAVEAYLQVRGTLEELRPRGQADLAASLSAQVRILDDRAGFKVPVRSQGRPSHLPAHIQRQVLYVCREALNNIEKHAQADQVDLLLTWGESDLTVMISDDGRGFSPAKLGSEYQYGLTIMRER